MQEKYLEFKLGAPDYVTVETLFGEDDGVLVDGVLARRSPRLDLTDYSE